MKDRASEQQRLGQIMPRYAPDEAEQLDQRVGWEQFAGLPVTPRRAPWPTANSDDENIFAQVSDNKVAVSATNASAATSAFKPTVSAAQILSIVLTPAVISQIADAVIAKLPIVDFECPG